MYAEMKAIMASSLPNLHLPTYAGRCFFLKLGERHSYPLLPCRERPISVKHSYPLLPCRVPIRANASFCASLVSPHHTIPLVTEGPTSHLVEQQFSELNLNQLSGKVAGVRTRQHVNPLKGKLMVPVPPPQWEDIFPDPSLPIMVDIGCGSGRFLMMLAKRNAESCNYLGLEIRHQLVTRAKLWANELKLENLHYMVANATVSFTSILSTYPGSLKYVTILCPDPHFKARHHKRRVVQEQLVNAITETLVSNGQIFIQSDVKEVAEDMKHLFDSKVGVSLTDGFQANNTIHDEEGWLLENPLGLRSEREIHAIATGGRIYRCLYTRL